MRWRRAVVNGARALAGEATSEEASYSGGRSGTARAGVGRSFGRRHLEVDGIATMLLLLRLLLLLLLLLPLLLLLLFDALCLSLVACCSLLLLLVLGGSRRVAGDGARRPVLPPHCWQLLAHRLFIHHGCLW